MENVTITWTGQRSVYNPGLLYQAYTDLGDVHQDGRWIGYVLHLPDGYYQPKLDGIAGTPVATPDAAVRAVVEMYDEFRGSGVQAG